MSSKNVFETRRRGNDTTTSLDHHFSRAFVLSIFKQLEYEALNYKKLKVFILGYLFRLRKLRNYLERGSYESCNLKCHQIPYRTPDISQFRESKCN